MSVSTDGAMGAAAPDGPDPKQWPTSPEARRRLPELIRAIGSDVSLLLRQERDLAKQEMQQIASQKAGAGAAFAVAALFAIFVVGFIGATGAAALDLVMPRWAAWLIVAVIYLIVAGIAALIGRRLMAMPSTPERTKQRVKEDMEWAKRRIKR